MLGLVHADIRLQDSSHGGADRQLWVAGEVTDELEVAHDICSLWNAEPRECRETSKVSEAS
jgi:hypothetical protein